MPLFISLHHAGGYLNSNSFIAGSFTLASTAGNNAFLYAIAGASGTVQWLKVGAAGPGGRPLLVINRDLDLVFAFNQYCTTSLGSQWSTQ